MGGHFSILHGERDEKEKRRPSSGCYSIFPWRDEPAKSINLMVLQPVCLPARSSDVVVVDFGADSTRAGATIRKWTAIDKPQTVGRACQRIEKTWPACEWRKKTYVRKEGRSSLLRTFLRCSTVPDCGFLLLPRGKFVTRRWVRAVTADCKCIAALEGPTFC